MARHVCPECAQGKHSNCDGNAWDNKRDVLALCECPTCGADAFVDEWAAGV